MADVDLMATIRSRKFPFYYAWSASDPEAWATDAMAQDVDWGSWRLPYCFPPFALVGAVLAKTIQDRVRRMILVVPWYPSKTWFPMLISMMLDARRFRVSSNLLRDMATGLPPLRVRQCRLVGCLITGRPDSRMETDSQTAPDGWSRQAGESRQSRDMGTAGSTGSSTAGSREYQEIPLL